MAKIQKNSIKHFEDLWNDAEKISIKQFQTLSNSDLIEMLIETAERMRDIEKTAFPREVKISDKNKKIGEFLFALTALASRDSINVYSSLYDEIMLNS